MGGREGGGGGRCPGGSLGSRRGSRRRNNRGNARRRGPIAWPSPISDGESAGSRLEALPASASGASFGQLDRPNFAPDRNVALVVNVEPGMWVENYHAKMMVIFIENHQNHACPR